MEATPDVKSEEKHKPSPAPAPTPGEAAALAEAQGAAAGMPLFLQGIVHAKLTVSQPGDPAEEEADRVADAVMRVPESYTRAISGMPIQAARPQSVPGMSNKDEEETKKLIQAKEIPAQTSQATAETETHIQHVLNGDGQPLPESLLTFFESTFGYEFSKVRIHTDAQAAESSQAISAAAYTLGRDIAFNVGQYSPQTREGKHLLAHELAHVIQQQGGDLSKTFSSHDHVRRESLASRSSSSIQRQDESPPPEPPYIGLSPTKIRVGNHQRFPIHYQVLNFYEPGAVSPLEFYNNAPATIIQGISQPTEPNQTGDMLLEANSIEGIGNLSVGFTYQGTSYSSSPITIEVTPGPSQISSPDRVYFDTDQAAIRADTAVGLDQVAARLAQDPSLVVICLEGHADTRYTDDYNLALSQLRAEAVYSYLMAKGDVGFHPDQVKDALVIGLGEQAPVVAPETNTAEFQLNRRVEIYLGQYSTGKSLTPSVTLQPEMVQAETGHPFSILYQVSNVHEPGTIGSRLIINLLEPDHLALDHVGGVLPSLPGDEIGILTFLGRKSTLEGSWTNGWWRPLPSYAEITLNIFDTSEEYSSNTVRIEIVGEEPKVVISFDREPGLLYVGDILNLYYQIQDMTNPSAYGGTELILSGDQFVVGDGLPIHDMVGKIEMQAINVGETSMYLKSLYNEQEYMSVTRVWKVKAAYRDFTLTMLYGIDGGVHGGLCYFEFMLQEDGVDGRKLPISFGGLGVTEGSPINFYSESFGTTSFRTQKPLRIEDFEGPGLISGVAGYAEVGGSVGFVHFGSVGETVNVSGFGRGLAASASAYFGYWFTP